MALYRNSYKDQKTGKQKQSDIWWYEFVYRGQRIRESAKTTRKTVAAEAEKAHRKRLEQAAAGIKTEAPAERIKTVSSILTRYQDNYRIGHRKKSVEWVKGCSAHLLKHLGNHLLSDLSEQAVMDYMKKRLAEGASNRTVNMELETLSRAVDRTWRMLWPKVKRLDEPKTGGRALSSQEQTSILDAAGKSRSKLASLFVRVALLTGMRLNEIRQLTWGQVDLMKGLLIVGKSKTAAGEGRVIPLNSDLQALFTMHLSWFESDFGEIEPAWYVFPSSSRIKPLDPAKPITGIKTAWEAIRKLSGVQCRFHDLRHTVITTLAERGVPEQTMKALVGHVSKQILERYTHIRMNAKRDAVEALNFKPISDGVPQVSPKVDPKKSAGRGKSGRGSTATIN